MAIGVVDGQWPEGRLTTKAKMHYFQVRSFLNERLAQELR